MYFTKNLNYQKKHSRTLFFMSVKSECKIVAVLS